MNARQADGVGVTVPDTFAQSHIQAMSLNPGATVDNAVMAKSNKYEIFSDTRISVVTETCGSWSAQFTESVLEIRKRISLLN